jgi:hypothetical protein
LSHVPCGCGSISKIETKDIIELGKPSHPFAYQTTLKLKNGGGGGGEGLGGGGENELILFFWVLGSAILFFWVLGSAII